MENLTSVHEQALDATGAIVARIQPDHWRLATPCDGWDVRFLTNHIVSGNLWAAELASGKTIDEVGNRLDDDILGDDPTAMYQASARAATEAFEVPGALEAPCAVSYGPIPGSIYIGHRIIDVIIHGWDLAVATGQGTSLNPDLVDSCTEIIEPQADVLLASGAFGRVIDVPRDANGQARLLAQLGRRSVVH